MQFTIARTLPELGAALTSLWQEHKSVALVPTMGALHEGHLSLVEEAKRYGGVVATIFINPLQFNEEKDFTSYTRDEAADIKKCQEAGVELLYIPSPESMYSPDFGTLVTMGGLAEMLEGMFRPGHFNGVCTVLTKLFNRIMPNVVLMGEKDYQQLLVTAKLVRDLDMPIQIIGLPTVREESGLALSSRNARLSTAERKTASQVYALLGQTARELQAKPKDSAPHLKAAYDKLIQIGFTKVDYVALCDAASFEPLAALDRPARLLVAAFVGNTRLIDNIPVNPL